MTKTDGFRACEAMSDREPKLFRPSRMIYPGSRFGPKTRYDLPQRHKAPREALDAHFALILMACPTFFMLFFILLSRCPWRFPSCLAPFSKHPRAGPSKKRPMATAASWKRSSSMAPRCSQRPSARPVEVATRMPLGLNRIEWASKLMWKAGYIAGYRLMIQSS